MMAVGAQGVNQRDLERAPAETVLVTTTFLEGKLDAGAPRALRVARLHALLFVEPNPAPAKAALALEGAMTRVVRGPLAAAPRSSRRRCGRMKRLAGAS